MKTIIGLAVAAAALGAAAPAMASTTFSLTGNDSTTYGSYGNTKTFTATSNGVTYKVQASAWELDGTGAISAAHLGAYSPGLGVTNKDEGYGLNNEHTIDNLHGVDFVVLQFDNSVSLTSASLTPYSLYNDLPKDTDASYSHATTSVAWNTPLSLSGKLLNDLTANIASVSGNGQTGSVALNSAGATGNVWLLGADVFGVDCNYDAFKLSGVTVTEPTKTPVTPVTPAVPEPATWATMMVGFGAVGSAMRRRAGRRTAQAV